MNNLIAISCFSASVVAITTSSTFIDSSHWATDLLYVGVALLCMVMLVLGGNENSLLHSKALLPFLGIGVVYLLSTIASPTLPALKHTTLILFCASAYFSCRRHSRVIANSRICLMTVIGCNLILFCRFLVEPNLLNILVAKNSVGWTSLYLTGMSILLVMSHTKKAFFVVMLACLALLVFAVWIDHRTVVVIAAAIPVLFYAFKLFWKSKLLMNSVLWGTFAVAALAVWAVVVPTDLLDSIDHQARSMEGGRRAKSGRDVLWPEVVSMISERYFTGYGAGEIPRDYSSKFGELSTHNLYLQVAFQVGVVGVLLLIWLTYGVWRDIVSLYYQNDQAAFGATLLVISIVNNTMEVSLLQNNMTVGFFTWMALGLTAGIAGNAIQDFSELQSRPLELS